MLKRWRTFTVQPANYRGGNYLPEVALLRLTRREYRLLLVMPIANRSEAVHQLRAARGLVARLMDRATVPRTRRSRQRVLGIARRPR